MKKEDFLNDVRHEVEMLKKHAYPVQLNRLDFDTFDPDHRSQCIYGQMTGSCYSREAQTLMNKACIKVFNTEYNTIQYKTFTEIKGLINGKYNKQTWKRVSAGDREMSYLSALEGYILLKGAKNHNIIDYLQGKKDKLVL